jgi:hypothetical protein
MAIYTFDIIRFGIILLALLQFTLAPFRPGQFTLFWNLVAAGWVFFMLTFFKIQLDDANMGWEIFLVDGSPEKRQLIFGIFEEAFAKSAMLTIGGAVTALLVNRVMISRPENK